MQLRFISFAVVSSRKDFHLQDCTHAGRTMRKTGIAGFIIRDAFLQYPLERVLHPLSLFKAIKQEQEQRVEGRPVSSGP